jgi:uncharacterized Fe-S center protein
VNFPVIRALRLKQSVIPAVLAVLLPVAPLVLAQDSGMANLVQERCLGCHEMDKVCDVETNDPQWWSTAVLRMVEYDSDLLTDDEAAAMSAFLADGETRATVCVTE